jgi:hypothetical protein
MSWTHKISQIKMSQLSRNDKVLLSFLAGKADFKTGKNIYASTLTMHEVTEISLKGVSISLKSLIKTGIIIKVQDNYAIRKTSVYDLNVPLLDEWEKSSKEYLSKKSKRSKKIEQNTNVIATDVNNETCVIATDVNDKTDVIATPVNDKTDVIATDVIKKHMSFSPQTYVIATHNLYSTYKYTTSACAREAVPKISSHATSDQNALATTTNSQNKILAKTAGELQEDFSLTNEMQEIAFAMNFHPSKIQEAYRETCDYWKDSGNYPKNVILSWKGSLLRKINHDKTYWTTSEVRSQPVAAFKKQTPPPEPEPISVPIPAEEERRVLHRIIGDAKYKSWFIDCRIVFKRSGDELMVYCPSYFVRDYLDNHFKSAISKAFNCENVDFALGG